MANRAYSSQFSYSFERQPVRLMGAFTISQVLATASLAVGPLTLTAQSPGAGGNSITIALINPGSAHALSIAVTGNHISVTLAHNGTIITSDYGDLAAALQSSAPVLALITTTGSSGTVVSALAQTPLAGGADSIIPDNAPSNTMSLEQTGPGEYTLSLVDPFQALIAANISLQSEDPQFLIPQISSANVAFGSSKSIVINMINTSEVNVDLTVGNILYIDITLRNASVA